MKFAKRVLLASAVFALVSVDASACDGHFRRLFGRLRATPAATVKVAGPKSSACQCANCACPACAFGVASSAFVPTGTAKVASPPVVLRAYAGPLVGECANGQCPTAPVIRRR